MNVIDRISARALAVLASLLTSSTIFAQEWPQRLIKLVVGTAPGGLVDIVGRIIAKHLGEHLGKSVVVEKPSRCWRNIAAKIVATAPAGGHTLLLTGNNHAVNPTFLPNPGFR